MLRLKTIAAVAAALCLALPAVAADPVYPWLGRAMPTAGSIESRIAPPAGFMRQRQPEGSFADWLRHLPLRQAGSPVHLYDGRLKYAQHSHHAVIDIDTGREDLQQCADAVMRLRAEYLYSRRQDDAVHFNYTSGDAASWTHWAKGYRPQVTGNKVRWRKTAGADLSYPTFREYLDSVFMYAGTASLSKELFSKRNLQQLAAGDVFIKGGFPGHAVLVVDVARDPRSGEKLFLLAQSYMPAQDIHVLINPNDMSISPWYRIPDGAELRTPEWTFKRTELKSFGTTPALQKTARELAAAENG